LKKPNHLPLYRSGFISGIVAGSDATLPGTTMRVDDQNNRVLAGIE
jgi:hypothetical protein